MISETEDQRFRTELSRSWEAVKIIAERYQAMGYEIDIPPPRCREDFAERDGYGDEHDITIKLLWATWRFEVKWRQIDFTCAEDFPYPTIFIDRVEKVDQNLPNLAGYLSINQNLTHCALIPAGSRRLWIVSERFDRKKGYPLTVYECPKEYARFSPIDRLAERLT